MIPNISHNGELEFLVSIYERYTAKYATFSGMDESDKYKNKASSKLICDIDGKEYPESRFFIKEEVWNNLAKNFNDEGVIAWRSLTSATNRRTMLATVLPLLPTCQSIQILQLSKKEMLHILVAFMYGIKEETY